MSEEVRFRKFHAGQRAIASELSRFNILRMGRRFGKTTLLEEWSGVKALRGWKIGWFAPSYKLIIPSYARINETLRPIRKSASKIDGLITLEGGGSVEFWSLDNEDAGRSRSYDLVLIDEASLVTKGLKDTWDQAIKPTLLDRGGRAIMAGTPKGIDHDNYFYQACTDKSLGWKEFHAPTSSNPTLDPEGVANLINEYPPLVYQQEFLAEFVDWNGSAFFAENSLLLNGLPVEYPDRCDLVYAVVDTALKDGIEHDGTAIIWFSKDRRGTDYQITILDYDLIRIEGSLLEQWLPTVQQRCEDLAKQVGARYGHSGTWIEDKASGIVLIQQAQRRGLNVFPIDSGLTALGKEARALSVSGYVHQGLIKFSKFAFDKIIDFQGNSRNHLISQVCGFRLGTKTPHGMDLLDCFTYGASIGLGDSDGF